MPRELLRCRTFRYRLHPTFRQTQSLLHQLEYQREIYNAALEERINVWVRERRSVAYFEQCRTLTDLKEIRPEVLTSGVRVCRGTLKRLDRAFAAFYRRVQRGETPGFPRFKSASRFDSLQWEDTGGWKVKPEIRRLYLQGIGEVKANYHRPLAGVPKAITVKREGTKWWVSIRCVDVPATPLEPCGREIGLDLGVKNLVATSDGELIVAPRFGSKSRDRVSDAQRSIARCKKGSTRQKRQILRFGNIHRKISNRRRNAAHQLSRQLINDFDFIAVEDLEIAKMVRASTSIFGRTSSVALVRQRTIQDSRLSKMIYDAGWGTLLSLVQYKAESAGRILVSVDPRYTSQTCAECGNVDAGNRVSQAMFRCLACGHQDNADVNAARNILRAGRAQHESKCAGSIVATSLYPRRPNEGGDTRD
jgi:putative transposase